MIYFLNMPFQNNNTVKVIMLIFLFRCAVNTRSAVDHVLQLSVGQLVVGSAPRQSQRWHPLLYNQTEDGRGLELGVYKVCIFCSVRLCVLLHMNLKETYVVSQYVSKDRLLKFYVKIHIRPLRSIISLQSSHSFSLFPTCKCVFKVIILSYFS